MSELLLHPQTAAALTSFGNEPPQAMLLVGAAGSGKRFAAEQWLRQRLQIAPTHIRIIAPAEKVGISVAQIRDLYHATRSRQIEAAFFIIDGAGSMSAGAQNAFLKLLEEPNSLIHFILTANTPDELLPTIRSRVQQVTLQPVSSATLTAYLQKFDLDAAALQQIMFITEGRVGLAMQLAEDPALLATYQQLAAKAKRLLASTPFERLTVLNAIASDRPQAITFLEIAAGMASMLLQKAAKTTEQRTWTHRLSAIHDCLERLSANGNLKIQLTRLALTL
ncbi:MAG TPA: AAA family ATPase [Candidatus Saccharimonadales bacterium]|nr:AAA family ATPase [Candidatus Saccharimonadales bacterium]